MTEKNSGIYIFKSVDLEKYFLIDDKDLVNTNIMYLHQSKLSHF